MRLILFLISLQFSFSLVAQTKTDGTAPKAKEINLSDTALNDYAPNLNSMDKQPT